jgi:hypothetical protein
MVTPPRRTKATPVVAKSPPAEWLSDFRRYTVKRNADRHLALYLKTGDGLLIWRAYQEYRKAGLPIPENLLKKFDEFALRLERAGSAKEVATAFEMGSRSGPAGATLTKGRERQRDIVEYVRDMLENDQAREVRVWTDKGIYQEAAKRFDTSWGYVKKTYLAWMREE